MGKEMLELRIAAMEREIDDMKHIIEEQRKLITQVVDSLGALTRQYIDDNK